jgi:hypothetical protein
MPLRLKRMEKHIKKKLAQKNYKKKSIGEFQIHHHHNHDL